MNQQPHSKQSSRGKTKHSCKYQVSKRQSFHSQKDLLVMAQDRLLRAGYKFTKQRLGVLQILIHAKKPLTTSEIYKQVSQTTQVDRVSTYRVIEVLRELNLIHQVGDSGLVFCFHTSTSQDIHFFLLCEKCKCVEEIQDLVQLSDEVKTYVQKKSKFKLTGQIQVLGICEHCA